jgi:peptide/nickel transport system ATP-binding protein
MLEVNELTAVYALQGKRIRAVDHVSFSVKEGEVFGIAGESGSGKSTLAHSISFLFPPPLRYEGGSVLFNGKDLGSLGREKLRRDVLGSEISYVPQSSMNSLNPTKRVRSLASDIFNAHGEIDSEEIRRRTKERIELLSLPDSVLDMYPVELSGGMKQRVVIALSTLMNPELLIADEPTSALDVSSQRLVLGELKKLLERGSFKSMILITHELTILKNMAQRMAIMYAGEFVEMGETRRIFEEPVHPYTRALMASIIEPGERVEEKRIRSIPGAPPDLKGDMPYCRFYDRCAFACGECKNKQELVEVDGRLVRCGYARDI